MRYDGDTAVCGTCGRVYYKAKGHNCPGPRRRSASVHPGHRVRPIQLTAADVVRSPGGPFTMWLAVARLLMLVPAYRRVHEGMADSAAGLMPRSGDYYYTGGWCAGLRFRADVSSPVSTRQEATSPSR